MAKLDQYRQYVQKLLTKHASYKLSYEDIEVETTADCKFMRYSTQSKL